MSRTLNGVPNNVSMMLNGVASSSLSNNGIDSSLFVQKSSNLSDILDKTAARANLGVVNIDSSLFVQKSQNCLIFPIRQLQELI
jgi:hypothetical protein